MSYKPYYTGGWQSGESGGTPLTPEALQHFDNGIMSAHRAGQPPNLLRNSYFEKFKYIVNQRGLPGYDAGKSKYTIDGWATYGMISVNPEVDYLTFSTDGSANLYQYFEPGTIIPDQVYTMVCCMWDNTVHIATASAKDGNYSASYINADRTIAMRIGSNYNGLDHFAYCHIGAGTSYIKWFKLFKGAYTVDTIPEHQSEDYAAELAACQLYFNQLEGNESLYAAVLNGFVTNGGKDIIVSLPVKQMRILNPTADITGAVIIRGINGYIGPSSGDVVSVAAMRGNGLSHNLKINKLDGTSFADIELNNTPVTVSLCVGTKLTLSAEL